MQKEGRALLERLSHSKNQADKKVNLHNYPEGEYQERPIECDADFTVWASQESDFSIEIDKTHPNLFVWWREEEHKYETWAWMGYDHLPIPAMSAEVERIFSR